MEYFDRIISLGQDCSVAGSLRNIKYKDFSYPFDWNVTKLEFIIDCFTNKFNNFNEIFINCEKSGNGKLKYKNKIYFYHEPKKLNDNFKKKYLIRSNRLINLLDDDKKILFVRKAPFDTIDNILILKNIINNNFPKLNFKILLINNIKNICNDKFIIHVFKPIETFLKFENDIYIHRNQKLSYESVYNEISKFKSIKFKQPNKRDIIDL